MSKKNNKPKESKLVLLAGGSATSPQGFRAAAVACGLKKSGKPDLALLVSESDCTAAGVFTRNQVVAAPVLLDQKTLKTNNKRIRVVATNAGNANACTGEPGMTAAKEMQRAAAELFGFHANQVLILSTGIIGVPLPIKKVKAGLRFAADELSKENGEAAARAIMTTDTRPKHLAVHFDTASGPITIGGMAKGSGMIHPDMATMLAVITTDATVPSEKLPDMVREAVNHSFNRISVDGDTSTNDTVLVLANGASGITLESQASWSLFVQGVKLVCTELAKMIVRDGEGASKFVEIRVSGLESEEDAQAVARTIATSPLVKTALAGGDPNWGRILAAAGRAGVSFDQRSVKLWIRNFDKPRLQLVHQGIPTEFAEIEALAIFNEPEIHIHLDLGKGPAEVTVWTCDLTHDYVTINADYRT
ncbi:MAG: bifunctional glutamate N-acetyltransferase/amino-acid acetyltransferase ArgJ [Candidatus Promineifilaceae bacterium]